MRDASSRTDPDAGPLHPDQFPPGDADRPSWKDRVTASVNHATSGPSSSTARQPPTHRWMPSACCPLSEPLDEGAERKPFPGDVQHRVFRLPLDGTAPFARRQKSSSAAAETARAEPEPLHARAQRGGGADPGSVNWALRGRRSTRRPAGGVPFVLCVSMSGANGLPGAAERRPSGPMGAEEPSGSTGQKQLVSRRGSPARIRS